MIEKKPYKILFVHGSSDNIAGQEIALLNSIQALSGLDVESAVLLPDEGKFASLLKDNRIHTFKIPLNRLSKKNPFPYLKTVFSIFKLINKEGFSIVHASGAYPNQYCLPSARLARIPCIAHIHATVYSRQDIRRSFVPWADYVIAVSEAVRNQMIKYGCLSNRTETVCCGVLDTNYYAIENSLEVRKQYGIPVDYKLVGQVSQIIPRKGLEYFIEMAQKIKKEIPRVKFIIVGGTYPGEEKYLAHIKQIIRERGMEEDIIFTGFQRDVRKLILSLDISVLASLSEALPLSIVESLAYGKPVVATSVGGISEVIIDKKTGLLVAPKDSNALANAVLQLLRDPVYAKNIAEEGKRFVSIKFSKENHGKAVFAIYNSLLKNA